jgi:two-component system, OmpR family, response regulator
MFNRSMTRDNAIRILSVIDDQDTRVLVEGALRCNDMLVTSCDGVDFLPHVRRDKSDLIILDMRRCRGERLSLLPELLSSSIPVIAIDDGNCALSDRVVALELGADDYILEPIAARELVARVKAILRRRGKSRIPAPRGRCGQCYRFAGMTFDVQTRYLANSDGTIISLTNREYAILLAFLENAGWVLTRENLLSETRMRQNVFDRSIDVAVLRLRRKLEGYPPARRIIETKRGFGYVIEVAVEYIQVPIEKSRRADRKPAIKVKND